MSSATARAALRLELAAAFPSLPQFDTLGVRVDNATLPALWATTDFIPISDNAIAIGMPTCRREVGTFRVYVVSVTGAGEATMIEQASAILAHFRTIRVNGVRVTSAIPPAPSDFSDGRWLICATDFTFSHDYFA